MARTWRSTDREGSEVTASLHVLPVGNLLNVAQQLRAIADEIDAGQYGEVTEGALVLNSVDVFGLGGADGTVTHYLLARGQRKLERIDLL